MSAETYDFVGFYTIVLTKHSNTNQETVANILKDCWSLYIANVIVLIPTENYEQIELYTYFPYTPEHCEGVEPVLYDYFENGTFALNVSIFPDKFRNFHKCPLTASLYHLPPFVILKPQSNGSYHIDGIEGTIVRVIAEQLNFTTIVQLSRTNILKNITNSSTNAVNDKQSVHPRSLDMV